MKRILNKTKLAVEAYDRFEEEFNRIAREGNNQQALEALKLLTCFSEKIGEAFYEDTKDVNPPEVAKLMTFKTFSNRDYIRRSLKQEDLLFPE